MSEQQTDPPTSDRPGSDRMDELSTGVSRIRSRGGIDLGRAQLYVGSGLAVLGLLVIFLGWWAAARTPFLFEQVPYLISGGMLGLAFAFLGGFLYFAYWVTRLVNESREQADRTMAVLEELSTSLGTVSRNESNGGFVATATGSQFHLPDCPAVSGKGVRTITSRRGLTPCKICDPLGS